MRTLLFGLACLLLFVACGESPPVPGSLAFTRLAIEGTAFTDIAFVPGRDDEIVVTEHGTGLAHYRLEGDAATLLGTVEVPDVLQMNDCGVHSVVFDPGWADNGFVFVGHCGPDFTSRVTRLTWDGASYDVGATAQVIVDILEPQSVFGWNHSIGSLRFDGTGALFVPIGDKAAPVRGDDPGTAVAAILRIFPSRAADEGGYEIPADNPFAVSAGGAIPEVYVYGTRYPWRLGTDRSGRLWFGDVGEGRAEEVNLVSRGGLDFGWGEGEGRCEGPCDPAQAELVDPLTSWGRSGDHPYFLDDPDSELTSRRSVWVGDARPAGTPDVYEGRMDQDVFFGDVCLGWFRGGRADETGALVEDSFVTHLPYVVSFAWAPSGEAYAVTFGSCDSNSTFEPASLHRLDIVPGE